MQQTDDRPPDVDELYISASHTSNLRVEAERRGPGDVLIAAGWSKSRVGMALLRLMSEWDGSAKGPNMTDTDFTLLRIKLKSLSSVLDQMGQVMGKMGIPETQDRVGPIVGHWLCQDCPTCRGLKLEVVKNAPALSALRCKSCHGTGKRPIPMWQVDRFSEPDSRMPRRVLGWMDDAVNAARASIRQRLRG